MFAVPSWISGSWSRCLRLQLIPLHRPAWSAVHFLPLRCPPAISSTNDVRWTRFKSPWCWSHLPLSCIVSVVVCSGEKLCFLGVYLTLWLHQQISLHVLLYENELHNVVCYILTSPAEAPSYNLKPAPRFHLSTNLNCHLHIRVVHPPPSPPEVIASWDMKCCKVSYSDPTVKIT